MLVECNTCESKVDAKVIGNHEEYNEDVGESYKTSLCICPICDSSLLAVQEHYQTGPSTWEWSDARRLWPNPHNYLHWSIPIDVRNSLEEAQKCFKVKAYRSCAVMCGRAIEAICVEKTGKKTLYEGLKKLKDTNVIDDRLFSWGDALRKERNIGAHASEETVNKEDAQDILDFAMAIADYIYVMTAKFDAYQDRKKSNLTRQST